MDEFFFYEAIIDSLVSFMTRTKAIVTKLGCKLVYPRTSTVSYEARDTSDCIEYLLVA